MSLLGPIRRNLFRRRTLEHWLMVLFRFALAGIVALMALQPLKAEWHRTSGFLQRCNDEGICK